MGGSGLGLHARGWRECPYVVVVCVCRVLLTAFLYCPGWPPSVAQPCAMAHVAASPLLLLKKACCCVSACMRGCFIHTGTGALGRLELLLKQGPLADIVQCSTGHSCLSNAVAHDTVCCSTIRCLLMLSNGAAHAAARDCGRSIRHCCHRCTPVCLRSVWWCALSAPPAASPFTGALHRHDLRAEACRCCRMVCTRVCPALQYGKGLPS